MTLTMVEPTDLEMAMYERHNLGVHLFGPLTSDEQNRVDAYEAYMEDAYKDHEEEMRTGRQVCPSCHQRAMKSTVTPTRQYGGGWDTYYECENCDHKDICV